MNLLIHHGALGDFVLTFPLLAAMTEPITVVTHASKATLAARLFPHVYAADIESPSWSSLFAADAEVKLPEATRVISFVSDGDDAWAANMRRLRPEAQCYFIAPKPPAGWAGHVTGWHRQELMRQGWGVEEAALNRKRAGDAGVVIHMGSGGRDKCWPADRFAAVAERLRANTRVRVIAGEAEAERGLAGDAEVLPTLDALHDVLADASLYIGNDSGPTHLAAWLGVPTVALFGPSDPRLWAPIGPAVTVLAPPAPRGMTWLDVETVLAAANSRRYDETL